MVELELTGWTPTQRDGLAFLLDDAQIPAEWGPGSVSVPEASRDQAQRFVDFLADTSGDVTFEHAAPPPGRDAAWILDAPPAPFTDELGFSGVATPGLRLGGALIDGLLLSLAGGLILVLSGSSSVWIQVALVAGYQIGMVGLLGRTLGNIAVHTRVVAVDDRGYPGLRAGFIRWLVPQAGWLLALALSGPGVLSFLWSLVVYIPVLIGPGYRGLHDRAAGVIVLDDRLTTIVAQLPEREPDQPSAD
jgi:uncharacterized RDD family membrane protein YckC